MDLLEQLRNIGRGPSDRDPRWRDRIHWRHIAAGPEGTAATLREMRFLARQGIRHPRVQELAAWFYGAEPSLDQWLRDHWRYRAEDEELIRSVDRMMADLAATGRMEGDCDDAAIVTAAVLRAMGAPARFVAIRYDPADPEFRHVFVEAELGGVWGRFDATVPAGTLHYEIERMTQEV